MVKKRSSYQAPVKPIDKLKTNKTGPTVKYVLPFLVVLVPVTLMISKSSIHLPLAIGFLAFGLFLPVLVNIKIIKRIYKRERVEKKHIIAAVIAIIILLSLYWFYLQLKAGLLHGDRTLSSQIPWQILLTAVVLIVLPAINLAVYRRTLSRRLFMVLTIIASLLLISSLIYITPGVKARLVDENQKPIPGAYVFYKRQNYFLFSNWSTSHFTRTDSGGNFSIPIKLNFCLPFEYSFGFKKLSSEKMPIFIYSPGLYNYCRVDDAYTWTAAKPGTRRHLEVINPPPGAVVMLHDMRSDPGKSFRALFQLVFRTPITGMDASAAEKRELISLLQEKYDWFVKTYGDRPRQFKDEKITWNDFFKRREYGRTLKEELHRLETRFTGKRAKDEAVKIPLKYKSLIPPSPAQSRYPDGRPIASPVLVKDFKKKVPGGVVLSRDIDKDGTHDLIVCGLVTGHEGYGNISVLNGKSGESPWTFKSRGIGFSSPLIAGDIIYCKARLFDGKAGFDLLYALDLHDGQKRWEHRLPERIVKFGELKADDEHLYLSFAVSLVNYKDDNAFVCALDKKTGVRQWQRGIKNFNGSLPLAAGNKVYYAKTGRDGKRHIHCVDLKNWQTVWESSLEMDAGRANSMVALPFTRVLCAAAGNFLLCSDEAYIYALNMGDGSLKWKYKTIRPQEILPAVKDNTVYFVSWGIYAIDLHTGRQKWEFAPKVRFSAPPRFSGGVLYSGAFDGHVYALRLADGQKMWDYPLGGYITTVLPVGKAPALAVISSARQLYILKDGRL